MRGATRLRLNPFLPAWLPDLMRDLHIGKHRLDIRFWGDGEETAFQAIKGDPERIERCAGAAKVAACRYLASQRQERPAPSAARTIDPALTRTLS
jgi:hypothetical protein